MRPVGVEERHIPVGRFATDADVDTVASDLADLTADVEGHLAAHPSGDGLVTITQQPNDYTLALADAGTQVEGTKATAQTVTVPPNSSVNFPVGTQIWVRQHGTGQVTLAPGSGVTLRAPSGTRTRVQYSTVLLTQRTTDEWVIGLDATSTVVPDPSNITPADLTLLGWWSAKDWVGSNGDRVTGLQDRSAANLDVAQATSGRQPEYLTGVLNGHPGVRFVKSRNDELLSATITPVSAPWTLFAYFTLQAQAAFNWNAIMSANALDRALYWHVDRFKLYDSGVRSEDVVAMPGGAVLIAASFASGTWKLYRDGVLIDSDAGSPSAFDGVRIGNTGYGEPAEMTLLEAWVASGAISDADHTSLFTDYIATEWA